MALTRKSLKAMGLEDEKIDEIITMHTETVDALKEQRDQYKADAEALPKVKADLEKFTADAGKDPWKIKYEALKTDFDGFKTEQQAKETRGAKEKAYRDALKEVGVAEKLHDSILRVAELDKVELVDGKLKDADTIKKALKTEWGDFIAQPKTTGAKVETPPTGDPASHETEVIAKVREAMGLPKETKGS